MTIIAIQCPACRTTDDIPAPALFVDVDAATGDEGSVAAVTWVCGACVELVTVPVEWVPLLAVVSAGASLLENGEHPDEPRPTHPESPADGARLTPDDLLDFHQALQGVCWLDELCTLRRAPDAGATAAEQGRGAW